MAKQAWEQEVADFEKMALRSSSRFKRVLIWLLVLGVLVFVAGFYIPMLRAHTKLESQFRDLGARSTAATQDVEKLQTELKKMTELKEELAAEIKRREEQKQTTVDKAKSLASDLSARLKPWVAKGQMSVNVEADDVIVELKPAHIFGRQGESATPGGKLILCAAAKAVAGQAAASYEVRSFASESAASDPEHGAWQVAAARGAAAAATFETECGFEKSSISISGHKSDSDRLRIVLSPAQ